MHIAQTIWKGWYKHAVIQKNILERKIFYRIKIFDPIPIFNATGPVPFPAVIVGVGSGIVDITESEEWMKNQTSSVLCPEHFPTLLANSAGT